MRRDAHGDDLRDLLCREGRLAPPALLIGEERQHEIIDVDILPLIRFRRLLRHR